MARSNLNIKAILIGLAVDYGGSIVAGAIVLIAAIGYSSVFLGAGDPWSTIEQVGKSVDKHPLYLNFFSLLLGFIFGTLGGFVAAHMARGSEIQHALVTGLLSGIISIVFTLTSPSIPDDWFDIFHPAFAVLFALLGGYLRTRLKRREPIAVVEWAVGGAQPPIPRP